jgi:serine/threonine-protein kinase HipA
MLSPAFDVIYSHNPAGKWTSQHQMSANGKRDNFTRQDLVAVGESISLNRPQVILDEVLNAMENWPVYAKQAGVNGKVAAEIRSNQRLDL